MFPGTFAVTTPDKPAAIIAESGEHISYHNLDEASARLARWWYERGLRPGDGVALLSDNQLHAFEVYWAAARSGLYLTPVNHHLSADEVAYIVNDCGAKAMVVAAGKADLAETITPMTPNIALRLAYGGHVAGYGDYETTLADIPAEPLADQPRGSDMLYSSGTTGRPKGIRLPLPDHQIGEQVESISQLFISLYGFDAETVYLSPAPLYHAAPLRYCATIQSSGGTVVMMERFDAEGALRAIERYRVTHSQWVPTMFVRMLKLPGEVRARYDVSSLKLAIHAAAPCPVEVKQQMIDWWGPILFEYYAASEAHGVTFISSQEWLRKPGSVGTAGLGILHICADDGTERSTGEVGTVYFERDQMPFAYHNDPAKTREAQHPHHPTWTTTGDVGYVDEDGFLFLTDRKAFMIISGGVNIYPQEIENCLALHPKVLDVAVIGVPDPEMGESVKAFVQLPAGVEASEALAGELIDYVRERIAHYKAPRSVEFVDELPRTPTGKLVKHKLRERYRTPDAALPVQRPH